MIWTAPNLETFVHPDWCSLGVFAQLRSSCRMSPDGKAFLIFDRKMTGTGLFEAKSLLDPVPVATAAAATESPVRKRLPAREADFLTARDFFRTSWWSRLGTLFSRYPAHLKSLSATLFRDVPVRPRRFAFKQLSVSLVLHAAAFLLLPVLDR